MKRRKIILLLVLIILIVCIIPTNSIATDSVYDVVACADTTRIKPGENLTIYIYFVGVGNTNDNFILIYFNSDIIVEAFSVMGKKLTAGLADKGTNVQLYRWNISMNENISKEIDPFFPLNVFWGRNENKTAPFSITISTSDSTPSGDHDLKFVYLYKDDSGVWKEANDIVTFHVETPVEQVEFSSLIWNNYVLPFLGFMTAFVIFMSGIFIDRYINKKSKRTLKIKLFEMIKDEIIFNEGRTKQIKEKIPKHILPNFRLKTENKDTSWTKIVEYWNDNTELIINISKIYNSYDLLNRTIDLGFGLMYRGVRTPDTLVEETKRICDVITTLTTEILPKFEIKDK